MWQELITWFEAHEELLGWLAAVSVGTFVVSILAVPILVVSMGEDFFVRNADRSVPKTPLRALRHLLKNALGYVLLVMGVAMLVLPGQGLLTIALGVSLIDFHGKRALQARLLRMPGVEKSVNWIREKADKPPLTMPVKAR